MPQGHPSHKAGVGPFLHNPQTSTHVWEAAQTSLWCYKSPAASGPQTQMCLHPPPEQLYRLGSHPGLYTSHIASSASHIRLYLTRPSSLQFCLSLMCPHSSVYLSLSLLYHHLLASVYGARGLCASGVISGVLRLAHSLANQTWVISGVVCTAFSPITPTPNTPHQASCLSS